MKICLISKECFPFFYGGIGSTFYALGRILSGLGHEVVLLSKKPANADQFDVNEHYTGNFRLEWFQYTEGQFFTHNRLDHSFQLEKYFEQFNQQFNATLVLVAEFDAEGYFILKENAENGKYPGVCFITHFSGPLFSLYESVNKPASWYEQTIFKMEEYCIRSSQFSIAPSSFIWEYLNSRFKLKHQSNYKYPNPLNPTVFAEPFKNVLNHEEEKNILFIGRLQDIKGADILLKAFAEYINSSTPQKTRLILIGADLYWDEYKKSFIE